MMRSARPFRAVQALLLPLCAHLVQVLGAVNVDAPALECPASERVPTYLTSSGPRLLVNVTATLTSSATKVTCAFSTIGQRTAEQTHPLQDGHIYFTFATLEHPDMLTASAYAATLKAGADACFVVLFPLASSMGYSQIRTTPTGISCGLARNAPELAGVYQRRLLGRRLLLPAIPTIWPVRSPAPPAGATGVGTAFTGGVDSWFSVVTHQRTLTDLVYATDFDVSTHKRQLWQAVRASLVTAAARLRLPLTFVHSNVRSVAERGWRQAGVKPSEVWGSFAHGHCIAAVFHVLSASRLRRVYMPSSQAFDEPSRMVAWGSDPMHDHLWSSDELQIVHDGAYATRLGKVFTISNSESAISSTVLSSLRVCWRNPQSKFNCGRCEKCLRTMTALEAAGVRGQCGTFEQTSTLELTSRLTQLPGMRPESPERLFWDEILQSVDEKLARGSLPQSMLEAIRREARPVTLPARSGGYGASQTRSQKTTERPATDGDNNQNRGASSRTARLLNEPTTCPTAALKDNRSAHISHALTTFFQRRTDVHAYPWVLSMLVALNYGSGRLRTAGGDVLLDRDLDIALFPRSPWGVPQAEAAVPELLSQLDAELRRHGLRLTPVYGYEENREKQGRNVRANTLQYRCRSIVKASGGAYSCIQGEEHGSEALHSLARLNATSPRAFTQAGGKVLPLSPLVYYIAIGDAQDLSTPGLPIDLFVFRTPEAPHPKRLVVLEGAWWSVPQNLHLLVEHAVAYTITVYEDQMMLRFAPWWRSCLKQKLVPIARAQYANRIKHSSGPDLTQACALRCESALSSTCESALYEMGSFTLRDCPRSG